MYKLPIEIDSVIKSECCTYYKTCILETTNDGRNWLAAHMNVYLDGAYNISFGDGLNFYSLDYYEPVLKFEPVNIQSIKPNQIVEYVKKLLRQRYYIITDCNISKISFSSDNDFSVHELLIYGYDDEEKVLFAPLLNNSTGKHEIAIIPYQKFESSYNDIRNYYSKNPDFRFWRTYMFFYPLTKVKYKKAIFNNDYLIFECLKKLQAEYNIEKRTFTRYSDDNDVEYTFSHYNGLGCLLGLEIMLEKTIRGEYDLKNSSTDLTVSLMRLYDHRKNIKNTLNLLDSLTNNCISENGDIIDKYLNLIEYIKKCYLMSKKWYITGNVKLLRSISETLRINRINESKVLRQAFDTVYKYINSTYIQARGRQYEKK